MVTLAIAQKTNDGHNPDNHFKICVILAKKKKGWIEIRPRFKIQYPMKNRGETNSHKRNLQARLQKLQSNTANFNIRGILRVKF